MPVGELAALCKVLDCGVSLAGLYNWLQPGQARQSARRAGWGTKQKTGRALSAARGGDFVLCGEKITEVDGTAPVAASDP